MELFARLSCAFIAGDVNIENDNYVNDVLNDKLVSFIKANRITEYRILNAESSFLPAPNIGAGFETVQCSIFIAYKAVEK
ncbi:hypothetical protein [Pedobacter immunditicola]|uniref:hypothetical protein n=1 Tax=Pedobacter immunditicola TaxID=3133440 RepID=UPI00309FB3BA